MRLARSWSICLVGLQAHLVEAEVSLASGLPHTVLVGLGDTAVREATERCRSAVGAVRLAWPSMKVTINLSPADLPKTGSHYDVAIVAAILAASQAVPAALLEGTVFLGELGLDGRVRPVRGVLPALLAAREQGLTRAVVPAQQAREAALVEGLAVIGVEHLGEVVGWLRGEPVPEHVVAPVEAAADGRAKDLSDVVGQQPARLALEVAAAGGHHLAFLGPPGVGKTLLAERLCGILPDLTPAEALEVSAIHSLVGHSLEGGLITRPPYADPHHSASVAALVGGGSGIALPGAVSLAHHGVLFLDEAPEFSPRALEALRTPLESGRVVHARSRAQTTYPARFLLVLASNPCPCGWHNVPGRACRCSPLSVRRYAERLSGPILDRVDIHARLRVPTRVQLKNAAPGETSARVAERVAAARERQTRRLTPLGLTTNGTVPGPVLRRTLPAHDLGLVEDALRHGRLTARGVDKVLRLAWTVADLAGHDTPTRGDVGLALQLRQGDDEEELRDVG